MQQFGLSWERLAVLSNTVLKWEKKWCDIDSVWNSKKYSHNGSNEKWD